MKCIKLKSMFCFGYGLFQNQTDVFLMVDFDVTVDLRKYFSQRYVQK